MTLSVRSAAELSGSKALCTLFMKNWKYCAALFLWKTVWIEDVREQTDSKVTAMAVRVDSSDNWTLANFDGDFNAHLLQFVAVIYF